MQWRMLALVSLLAVAAKAEVRVVVRTSDGHPVDRAYVAVVAPDRPFDAGEIDLSDPANRAVIRVPSAALRVRVVDRGEPLRDVVVRAVLRRNSTIEPLATTTRSVKTDAQGEATIDGLLSGRWLVQASGGDGVAESAVELRNGEPAAVELQLRPPTRMRGIVRHPDNSIEARARVDCFFAGPSGIPQTLRAETDGEGRFALDLPTPPPTRLRCGVTTIGGRIAAYTLAPATSADLVLPERTATLRIEDWGDGANRDLYWLVSGDRLFNLSWSNGAARRRDRGKSCA